MLGEEEKINTEGTEKTKQETPATVGGKGAKEETKGEEQKGTAPEDKGLPPKSEEKDPDKFDYEGIPWKDRAKEYERKYREVAEKEPTPSQEPFDEEKFFARFEKENNLPAGTYTADPNTGETPHAKRAEFAAIMRTAGAIQGERISQERRANRIISNAIDFLSKQNPRYAKYRNEITERLQTIENPQSRTNPLMINLVANAVLGEKSNEEIEELKKELSKKKEDKTLVSDQTGKPLQSQSSVSGGGSKVTLSAEEKAFAKRHGLEGEGYTDADIREMYSKTK